MSFPFLLKKILNGFYSFCLFFALFSCSTFKPLKLLPIKTPPRAKTPIEKNLHSDLSKYLLKAKAQNLTKKDLTDIQSSRKEIRSSDLLKNLYYLILGFHFLNKGLHRKSLSFFSKVDKRALQYEEASLQSVKIFLHLKEDQKALLLISKLLELKSLSKKSRTQLLETKYNILSTLAKTSFLEVLKVLSQLIEQKSSKLSIYQKKARSILFKIQESSLLDLRPKDFTDSLKSLIFYRSGKIMFYRGHFKKSYTFFKNFLELSQHSFLEKKAIKFIQAIESRNKVNPRHIGVILPLSGPSKKIGLKYLNGIRMALDLRGAFESEFKIIIRDSKGSPDTAKEAIYELVTQNHVIAILAGEVAHVAQTLATEAQNFGVPTILLSQSPKLFLEGDYVFQNGLSSYNLVDRLLHFLIDDLKFKNFAILYPNDSYGIGYANTFWQLALNKGALIKGAQTYKPGESDFNQIVSRLAGTYYIEDRQEEYKEALKKWYLSQLPLYKRKAIPDPLLSSKASFDVLFIPDSTKVLNLVLSHLIYHNINDKVIIGTNLWSNRKWLKKYPAYKGSIFFAASNTISHFDKTSPFYQSFVHEFETQATFFELSALESALAIRQMISFGARSRIDLQKKLSNALSLPSPIGPLKISSQGEFTRLLSIYQIENNEISEVKTP